MRFMLPALLVACFSVQATATELDDRYYVTPGIGYNFADSGRATDGGPEISVDFGRAFSESLNFEISAFYALLDNEAGGGETDIYGLGVGLLNFVDRGNSPVYSLLRLRWLRTEGQPGADYDSPAVDAGLGYWWNSAYGILRLEGALRFDLHGDDAAGDGGKDLFIDSLVRLAYTMPFGAEPEAAAPASSVDVVPTHSDDSDDDGVADDRDLCPGTPAGTRVDPTGCAAAEPVATSAKDDCRTPVPGEGVDEFGCAVDKAVILNNVNFQFDSAVLTEAAIRIMEEVALALEASPGALVLVAGHTSLEGDETYNVHLSQRRAQAVREFLVDRGIDPSRLQAKGFGSSRPVATNETVAGRHKNRRVEIKLLNS